MMNKRFLDQLTQSSVLTILLITLAACGNTSSGSVASGNKNLILATELPIAQVPEHDVGIAVQNAVDLAVQQNANLGGGYHLTVKHFDDSTAAAGTHDPNQGIININAIVADPQIVAAIGPFNSSVAASEIPIVNSHDGPVLISPSNTNPGLTLQSEAGNNGFTYTTLHPPNHKDFYFRMPSNDLVQGKLLADICLASSSLKGIGAKTAYVLDDSEVYGVGLAKSFANAFTAGGGTVAGTASISNASATAIVSSHPDIIFFGGNPGAGAGELKQAVAAAGAPNTLWVVGDGFVNNSAWFTEAGGAAAGTFGAVAGPDLTTLSSAATFVEDYRTAYKVDPLPYGAFAYDAAMIEISAIKALIASGQPVTRAAIRDRVAVTSYAGVTGTITFDANGDNAGSKIFSIWAVLPTAPDRWSLEQNVDASSI